MIRCWIVTPTLNEAVGRDAVSRALASGGVSCHTYVAVDELREGGTRTANRALAKTASVYAPFVCYINDDVQFPQQGWLARMIEALEQDARYGIAGPSGRCGTNPQKRSRPGMAPGIIEVKQLSYFVAVFKREVLDELGPLDEQFFHWGCDSDYNKRAALAGWKRIWVRDVWVEHNTVPHKQRSPQIQAWKKHDVAYYRQKWGKG